MAIRNSYATIEKKLQKVLSELNKKE